jgi:hypothetical protein
MGAVPCEPSAPVAAIPFYGFRSCFHGSERISLARTHDSTRGGGQQASSALDVPADRSEAGVRLMTTLAYLWPVTVDIRLATQNSRGRSD